MRIFCATSQVEEQIRTLQECYKNKPEEEEENEGTGASMKEMLDVKWQTLLQRFFTMQDLGNNFINSSNMVGHFGGYKNATQLLIKFGNLWGNRVCNLIFLSFAG